MGALNWWWERGGPRQRQCGSSWRRASMGGGVLGGGDWAGAAGMEWYGGAREVVLVVGMGTPTTGARGDSWGGACAWGGARGPCRGGRWMRLWSSSSNRTMARVGRVPRRYLAVSTRM